MLAVAAIVVGQPIVTCAQDTSILLAETWRFSVFNRSSGLPSARVDEVAVGPDGTVWAATTGGVAWYDDYFWHPSSESGSPPKGVVTSILPVHGSDDEVLVVTDLGVYRGGRGGFRSVVQAPTVNSIGALATIPGDTLLAVRRGKLVRFEGSVPVPVALAWGLSDETVFNVWSPQPGSLWISTSRGLYRREDGVLRLKLPLADEGYMFSSIAEQEDGSGLAHVARPSELRGIWVWGPDGFPRKLEEHDLEMTRAMARSIVTLPGLDLLVHELGDVSVREGEGLFRGPDHPALTRTLSGVADQRGDVWIGTEDGLLLYHRSSAIWSSEKGAGPRLARRVHEMARSADGSLWIATADGLEIQRPNGTIEHLTEAAGVRLLDLTGLAIDPEGNVWVSSGGTFKGVLRWDGETWRKIGAESGLGEALVHKIRVDRRGRVWLLGVAELAFTGERIAEPGVFVLEDGSFRAIGVGAEGTIGGRAYGMAEAADGSLWFATDRGISRLSVGEWRHWTIADGLRLNRTFSIAAGPDGRVWFSHQTPELGYIDRDGRVGYGELPQAISDTKVWELSAGDDGRIWLTGAGGVAVLDQGRWVGFGRGEGLPDSSVWPVLPERDRILFGTASGVVTLDLAAAAEVPEPRIIMVPPATYRDEIVVRWSVGTFKNLRSADRVGVRSRVDGGAWSDWSMKRELVLPRLDPGNHEVDVQAEGLLGQITTPVTALVQIPTPLSRSPWFLIPLFLFVSTSAGWMVYGVKSRRHRENLLRISREEYRALYQEAPDIYLRGDSLTGVTSDCNETAIGAFGYTREELVGRPMTELYSPQSHRDLNGFLAELARTGETMSINLIAIRKDGSCFDVEARASATYGEEGRVTGNRIILRDMTRLREKERHLRLFQRMIDQGFEPTFWVDRAGQLCYANEAACRLVGQTHADILTLSVANLDPTSIELFASRWAELEQVGSVQFECSLVGREGESIPVEVVATMVDSDNQQYAAVFVQDLRERRAQETERRRLDEHLRATQHLKALGTMAGGIAHEFNNILSGILGHGELLSHAGTLDGGHGRAIVAGALRARGLVGQILTFSRMEEGERSAVSFSAIVEEAIELLRVAIPISVTVEVTLDAQMYVLGDGSQLSGVAINLVKNAADAIGTERGVVSVSTQDIVLNEASSVVGMELQAGHYVRLRVDDDGSGMSSEVRDRIFEPFFTTKPQGSGTGLGLAVVHGVVESHGGSVNVSHRLPHGTSFEVILPAIEAPKESADILPTNRTPEDSRTRILVVDDEPTVAEVTCLHLEQLGYVAVPVGTGCGAIGQIQQSPDLFDLVITDLSMPDMTGVEVAQAVRKLNPGLLVLLMTGDASALTREKLASEGIAGLLLKPFRRKELDDTVAEALGREG